MQNPDPDAFDLSAFGTEAPARAAWPPAARAAVGCGLGCAALVVLEGLLAAGFTALFFNTPGPSGLEARVQAPARVTVGQPFPLALVVKNTGSKPLTLSAVTEREPLLGRLTLLNPRPAPTESLTMFGSSVWSYAATVRPGQKWSVRFQATVREAGRLEGSLEVESGILPTAVPFHLEAAPPGGKSPPPAKPARK